MKNKGAGKKQAYQGHDWDMVGKNQGKDVGDSHQNGRGENCGRGYKEQEQALRILEAMSGVDEMLLERSNAAGRSRKPVWQYGGTWAAVVCGVMLGTLAWQQHRLQGGLGGGMLNGAPGSSGNEAAQMSSSAAGMKEDGEKMNSIMSADGALPSEDAGSQGGMSPSMSLGGDGSQGGMSPSVPPGGDGSQGGMSPSMPPGGDGSQEGMSPSMPPGGDGSQGGMSPSAPPEKDGGQESVEDQLTTEVCKDPIDKGEALTEKEARAIEVLGEYIPYGIPKGYDFESANWKEGEGILSIGWSRGLDDIRLYVKQVNNCDTVDVNRTELYDVGLYDIPYGESVPEEYREVFNDPVFAWEDMELEVVQRRMRSYADSGDTGTSRGNFSILFPEGVLLSFRGDGTAELIWEMFQSLGL